jgi:hypothetical protein
MLDADKNVMLRITEDTDYFKTLKEARDFQDMLYEIDESETNLSRSGVYCKKRMLDKSKR